MTSTHQVLLVGGTSEIGLATVRRLLDEGPVRPYLLGRDRQALAQAMSALERDGALEGHLAELEAEDATSHAEVIGRAFAQSGGFQTVVLAVGALGGQAGLDAPPAEVLRVMRVNFEGAGSLLMESLRHLRDAGGGTVIVLSSVAAERARAGNAVYGAAKAGLDALAQGLADSLAGSGVRVLVVRPGFVYTRMTAHLPAAPMATTPDAVADAAVRALTSGRAGTIWVPARLRWVFAILRHLPRPLYRRLPL